MATRLAACLALAVSAAHLRSGRAVRPQQPLQPGNVAQVEVTPGALISAARKERLDAIYGARAPQHRNEQLYREVLSLWAGYQRANGLTDYAPCCGSAISAARHPWLAMVPYDIDMDLWIGENTTKHLMARMNDDPAIIPAAKLALRSKELDAPGIHIVVNGEYDPSKSPSDAIARYNCDGQVVDKAVDDCSFISTPRQMLIGRVVGRANGTSVHMDLWRYTKQTSTKANNYGFDFGAPGDLPETTPIELAGVQFRTLKDGAVVNRTLHDLYGADWTKPVKAWDQKQQKWVDVH